MWPCGAWSEVTLIHGSPGRERTDSFFSTGRAHVAVLLRAGVAFISPVSLNRCIGDWPRSTLTVFLFFSFFCRLVGGRWGSIHLWGSEPLWKDRGQGQNHCHWTGSVQTPLQHLSFFDFSYGIILNGSILLRINVQLFRCGLYCRWQLHIQMQAPSVFKCFLHPNNNISFYQYFVQSQFIYIDPFIEYLFEAFFWFVCVSF